MISTIQTDLLRARAAVIDAELLGRPADRFLAAHAAALQVAAVVLAARSPGTRRPRLRNAWQAVADAAPELAEWAAFFAATEAKRDAVRAGATVTVSAREADDLVRDTQAFVTLVERAAAAQATQRAARPIAR